MNKKEPELILKEGNVCLRDVKLSTLLREIVSAVLTQRGN